MKNFFKRTVSCVIAGVMLLFNSPKISIAGAEDTLPVIPKTIFANKTDLNTTWSKNGNGTLENPGGTNQYIYWGRYPQSEIASTTGLVADVDYVSSNGKDYRIEPIKWRILSTEGDKLFLMSEKCLDVKVYNSANPPSINWSNCELRTWLTGSESGSFLNTAFTSAQQGKIFDTTVSAPYAIGGGSDVTWQTPFTTVTDKLFILSGDGTNTTDYGDVGPNSELRNTAYGFAADASNSPTRQFGLTPFALSKNASADHDTGCGFSWTRSASYYPSLSSACAFFARPEGRLELVYAHVPYMDLSVVPALKISSDSVLFSSAASSSAGNGTLSQISDTTAMNLRFSGGQGTITTNGNILNYANAPANSSLVIVVADLEGKNYQYRETLTNESGSVDLSSKGFPAGSTYKAWVETEDNGVLNASNPVDGNLELIKWTITYKNYDGTNIENLPQSYPTTYNEGQALTLPTDSPDSAMSGWEFLGFWDQPLDQTKKVTIPGPGYEDEQTLDLTVGNKITEIPAGSTGNKTLYARYTTSNVFDQNVNDLENYIFAAPGVFPDGSTASMRTLESGTEEYQNALQKVDEKNIDNIEIVEFQVCNAQGELTQPNTFFGDVVIGFKIPEGFNVDNISLIRIVANGADITLRSKIWTDPNNPDLKYIEGTTDHFSPYAILSPWDSDILLTGDNTRIWVTGIYAVLLASAGVLILMSRKKQLKI